MTLISEDEAKRRERQRALSVNDFCARYGIGRSKFYMEKAAGRLKARKVGKRLIVIEDDAEEWLANLPTA